MSKATVQSTTRAEVLSHIRNTAGPYRANTLTRSLAIVRAATQVFARVQVAGVAYRHVELTRAQAVMFLTDACKTLSFGEAVSLRVSCTDRGELGDGGNDVWIG